MAQLVSLGPAPAMSFAIMVSVMEDTASTHGGVLVAVSVRTTVPVAISAALGKYTGFSMLGLLKDPVPEVVQNKPVYKDAEADDNNMDVWL